jgi:hypothetical protein
MNIAGLSAEESSSLRKALVERLPPDEWRKVSCVYVAGEAIAAAEQLGFSITPIAMGATVAGISNSYSFVIEK